MRIIPLAIALSSLVATVARAQAVTEPIEPPSAPPGAPPTDASTPPLVGTSPGVTYSPAAFGGNLRVDLQCADYFATAASGLTVAVDGAPSASVGVNGVDVTSYTRHGNPIDEWVPTDAGYVASPGHHHVAIAAPGCAPFETDLEMPTYGPRFIEGRLQISDPALVGATAAPNGFTHMFGAYSLWRSGEQGTATFVGSNPTSYSLNGTQFTGFAYSVGFEHRHLLVAIDSEWGAGTTAGMLANEPITSNAIQFGARLRIGYRVPMHDIALAFGSGIGGDMYIFENWTGANDQIEKPSNVEGDFIVPLWASITYKPSCNWGVQAMASYDVQPTDFGASAPTIAAGFMYQPNDACSQPAGVRVR